MWHRNQAKPVMYNGLVFRSALEAKVAEELDALDVTWAYEQRTPFTARYLPDFTITGAPAELQLPTWVEVKPPELLYAVRDHLGVPERFDEAQFRTVTASDLQAAQLTEIPKPKRLAEVAGEPVLVVSAINRNRTLSLTMTPEGILFARNHPAVNWKQVLHDRRREEEQRAWQARYARERAERLEREAERRQGNLAWARSTQHRPAKFEGVCIVCSLQQPADKLRIANHQGRWLAFCAVHVSARGQ